MALPDRAVTATSRRPARGARCSPRRGARLLLVLLGACWRGGRPCSCAPGCGWRATRRFFRSPSVGLRRLELTGLALGGGTHPEQLVGRLTIDYRPGDLLRGRIEALSVEG